MPFSDIFLKNSGVVSFLFLGFSFFLLLWNIFLTINISKMKRKNEEFFSGGKNGNLEDLLLEHSKTIKVLDKDIQELYSISNQINGLAFKGYHKIGLVRFNPFKDVGGDQSFAIAILNGKNDGITLSSLYGRDGARFYAKSIINGKSEKHPLTEEEKEAIEIAIKNKIEK